MKLERLMDRAQARVLKRLRRDGEVCPGVMLHSAQRGTAVIALPWESPMQKEMMLDAVAETMRLMDVEAYAIWSEVWMAVDRRPAGASGAPDVMPRLDPEREDAVVIVGAERGGASVARAWRVLKDAKGQVALEDVGPMTQAVGPLGDLLKEPDGEDA